MGIKSFRDLLAWQKGIELVEAIYLATASFPREELYGLTIQIRKAAVSIPSNIAEGQSRHTTRDFLNFLSIAKGSLSELETQLTIAERLRYISATEAASLLQLASEVGRLIGGLSRSLKESMPKTNH
jgi:four helix bundle protein